MLRAIGQFANGQPPRNNVPNLVIAQRVIDKMAAAAKRYIEDETGETLVGLIVPGVGGVPSLYILDTISPDETAVRHFHTFQQGDDLQGDIFDWWHDNWKVYRELKLTATGSILQPKWDVPLRNLGDWHKQPGFMIQPSGGDLMTALSMLDDAENNFDFLIAPILTIGHDSTTLQAVSGANFVTVSYGDETNIRIDFWYIDREVRLFQPIIPTVYPNDQLPDLPDYPWHLINPDLMSREYQLMQSDNLFTSVMVWNASGKPPLDVCFMTARIGADRVLIIITPYDFPKRAPRARVAPFVQMEPEDDIFEVFEELWEQSQPVENPTGWTWKEDSHLIDYVHALETSLGIEKPQVETPADGDGEEKP